jgi:hypothetical protein
MKTALQIIEAKSKNNEKERTINPIEFMSRKEQTDQVWLKREH